jgi:serine/threonine protein kinase
MESSLFSFSSSSGSGADLGLSGDFDQLNSIVAAAGIRLPVILPGRLTFNKRIGKGTSFEVNREIFDPPNKDRSPYYVAVKHVIPAPEADMERRRRRNDSVARELRTLINLAPVNSHLILPILGYGWKDSPFGRRPYIVVDYSEHGTLPEYLGRIKTTINERRELALDVAVGLKVLHNCNIAHGDLKSSNVLVFDALDGNRPQMAKLADFGAAIIKDQLQSAVYGGTPLYNAPEQEGRGRFNASNWRRQEDFYRADMWSFGLTLWEIMQSGRGYIQEPWLTEGQSRLDFLETVASSEIDGILKRATAFCEQVLQQNQQSAVTNAVSKTFGLTLRDDPHQRPCISEVIQTLAQGTTLVPVHSKY